ncbi:MAG: aldehyde dehydrogenase [Alphaproteobacteria bacterium]|nr:aldehyde dehydrogenase [Alphaproteobacteria bacterium]
MSLSPVKILECPQIQSTNPSHGYEILGSVNVTSHKDLISIVEKARHAQIKWQSLGVDKRCELVGQLLETLKANREEFIERTSREMGMPLDLSRGVVYGGFEKISWNLENAPKFLKPTILFEDDQEVNKQILEPFGVMACIVAWNFPFGNFATSVIPALLAGNTVVMKYSEEVPLFSKFLEEITRESKALPEGVLNFVYGDGVVGSLMCEQDFDLISFTGSSSTGQKIYEAAAKKLIPVCLELGGSSPGIVFEDTKLTDELIQSIFWKRFLNTAQFCDGLKRLIVHESLFDECVRKLSAYAATVKIGDPLDRNTQLGPLVAERQVIKLEDQIKDAVNKGAKIVCGGKRPSALSGAYYQPTILTNITPDMRVWKEEVFGPALPIVSFKNYDEALQLANDTDYGLSAVVYSDDEKILELAFSDIKAGSVEDGFTNYYRPQNPFGGYKQSGIGRQGGAIGFREVCQVKVKAYRK